MPPCSVRTLQLPLLSVQQELSLQVDGAQHLRVLCVSQSDGQDDVILGKTSVQVGNH